MPSFSTIGTANIKAFGFGGARPPAGAPFNLRVTVQDTNTINLAWQIADSRANTQIFIVGNPTPIATVGEGITAYSDPTLTSATAREYTVRHSKFHIPLVSSNSNFASATTPVNVAASFLASAVGLPTGNSRINLTWSANGETVGTTATVYYKKTSAVGGYVLISPGPSIGQTSYTVENLDSATNYSFYVVQNKNSIASASSALSNATTGLNAPTSVSASPASSTSLTVSWTNTESSAKTQLYYGDGTPIGTPVPAGTTSLVVSNLNSATSYSFKAKHVKNDIYSAFSGASGSEAPPVQPPTELVIESTTVNSNKTTATVNLRWTINDTGVTLTLLRRQIGVVEYSATGVGYDEISVTGTAYADITRETATQYEYRLRQVKGASTTYTNSVSQRTLFNAPGTPILSGATTTSVDISWPAGDLTANTEVWNVTTDTLAAEVLPSVVSTTVSGLSSGSSYRFKVRHKKQPTADTVQYTAFSATSDSSTTGLQAPTLVSATVIQDTRVFLEWANGDTSPGTTIEVWRADTPTGIGTRLLNQPSSGLITYTDDSVSPARDYTYYVRHVKGDLIATSNQLTRRPQAYFTGGTIQQYDGYRVHTFTDSDTLVLPGSGGIPGTIEFVLAAGGGGGGSSYGGGGGGGGVKQASALIDASCTVGIGSGGAADASGSSTTLSKGPTLIATAAGGGRGGDFLNNGTAGGSGGGGGTAAYYPQVRSGGAASPSGQGNAGGSGTEAWDYSGNTEATCYYNDCEPCTYFQPGYGCSPAYGGPVRAAGGGGGARTAGGSGGGILAFYSPYGPAYRTDGGSGGEGLANDWAGTGTRILGSGGGGSISGGGGGGRQGIGGSGAGNGGIGGGIPATNAANPGSSPHRSGGGGGGPSGGGGNNLGGSGSKGIAIIRYRYQP